MKKIFSLAALGLLSASAAFAQAPTLDGRIQPSEIGPGIGLYKSMGQYTNPRGFGDWGLKEAFIAEDANFIYIAIHGTVENNGNAFQIFFDVPNFPGVPACQALPAAPTASGDPTSFANMTAIMEMEVDAGVAYSVRGTLPMGGALGIPQLELCDYRVAAPASVVLGQMTSNGTPATFLAGAARAAYQDSPQPTPPASTLGGTVLTNTNEGLEFAVAKAAYGITNGTLMKVFVLMNNGDGGFLSSDCIPQNLSPTGNGNLGAGPDFCLDVDGTQSISYLVGTGIVPSVGVKKLAADAIDFSVSPNPTTGAAKVEFTVPSARAEQASVVMTDMMGRTVRTLANGSLAGGKQTFELNTSGLASGQYIVKLMLDGQVATRKVSVQ